MLLALFVFGFICRFSQSVSNDPVEEDDDCIKEDVMDCSKSVETENGDLSEMLEVEKKEKVASDVNGEPESVDAGPDETDVSKEPKSRDKACSPKVYYATRELRVYIMRQLFLGLL